MPAASGEMHSKLCCSHFRRSGGGHFGRAIIFTKLNMKCVFPVPLLGFCGPFVVGFVGGNQSGISQWFIRSIDISLESVLSRPQQPSTVEPLSICHLQAILYFRQFRFMAAMRMLAALEHTATFYPLLSCVFLFLLRLLLSFLLWHDENDGGQWIIHCFFFSFHSSASALILYEIILWLLLLSDVDVLED